MPIKSTIDEDTYKDWTYENTWALGLLTADGSFPGKSRPHEWVLYNTDIEMLEIYKDIFKSNKKIQLTGKDQNPARMGIKPVGRLALSNPKICNFLKSINLYGNKDLRNPFSNIPEDYKFSFIKGYFDGDGNLYRNSLSIAGRKLLIEDIYFWICDKMKRHPNKIYSCAKTDKTFYFSLSKGDTIKLRDLIERNTAFTYNSQKYKKLLAI